MSNEIGYWIESKDDVIIMLTVSELEVHWFDININITRSVEGNVVNRDKKLLILFTAYLYNLLCICPWHNELAHKHVQP